MYIFRKSILLQFFNAFCGSPALPYNCIIDRKSRMAIPDHSCFALIRNSNCRNLRTRSTNLTDCFSCNRQLGRPDFHGIMFYPSWFRIYLPELFLCHTADVSLMIK